MSIINLRNLGVTLGEPLFTDLNLTLSKGDRLGLVAANGTGKSTLLACLTGELEQTTGDITTARGCRIAAVAQYVPDNRLDQSLYDFVLSALAPEQQDFEGWRVDVVLDDLKIPFDLHHSALRELSGGWQRTAMLAAAWVTEPDVLLLDEPTNHLDLSRIGLLQNWLSGLPRDVPVIITSHDRAFLDETTNRTLFLRREVSRDFALPYTKARDALDEADAADERRFTNEMKQAQQLRKQAAKLKNVGINSGSDLLVKKTKQLNERAENMEAAAKPAYKERSAGDIKLGNSGTHAKALITLDNIQVKTPDGRDLYMTGQKWISRGDRVVVLGHNGVGKTQLVRMVQAALGGTENGIKHAPSVVTGYSDQALSQLDLTLSPLQNITHRFDVGDQRARRQLAGAGMTIAMQDAPAAKLSGGQKARLAMLVLRLTHPNFYLLDEPTNHLDIEGQEALEDELVAHGASCLLVSHDRSFIRAVGNRFWQVERNKLVEVDSPEPFFQSALADH
ncbi:ATP-binding cassette domain-containing protein [Loktanella sp. F6476L]|uniref:ABC-F family ATP-binding cassette domain-containing protein n=1 Tax=Loktanella sp. F6476L TaxID=2926405 RepID=UPI001FF5ADEE|nr:ABC-F family ATP-binding cassette domain-containing protein [Loktanella sp. F6476L]MCK0120483.1 ATP-binding cassette domain-containing protein [Loktanella sp. F6476L]